MMEAMLLSRPVIATRFSGNLDFMNDGNSLLIDFAPVILPKEIPPYPAGSRWAEPSIKQAAERMRWVYEHRVEAAALGHKAQAELTALLSPKAAGARMAERLAIIRDDRRRALS